MKKVAMEKTKHIDVVGDIELSDRYAGSMFLVALCAQDSNGDRKTLTRSFPEADVDKDGGTYKNFWMDEESGRKEFYNKVHEPENQVTREQAARDIRKFVDDLYASGSTVHFWSDFAVFDLGIINSFLGEYKLLPIFLKDSDSRPSEASDYTTYLKGYARAPLTVSTKSLLKKYGISPPAMSDNHDPELDVMSMMDTLQEIKNLINKETL